MSEGRFCLCNSILCSPAPSSVLVNRKKKNYIIFNVVNNAEEREAAADSLNLHDYNQRHFEH